MVVVYYFNYLLGIRKHTREKEKIRNIDDIFIWLNSKQICLNIIRSFRWI